MGEKIFVGNGILDQIQNSNFEIKVDMSKYHNFIYHEQETNIIPVDIGEYSMFIKRTLPSNTEVVSIKSKKGDEEFFTKNFLSTPGGTVLYFEESIKGIFKVGCMYPAIIYRDKMNWILD